MAYLEFLKIIEQMCGLSIRGQCVCRIREKLTLIFNHCLNMCLIMRAMK